MSGKGEGKAMSDPGQFAFFVVTVLAVAFFSAYASVTYEREKAQHQAIEHGCGQFNPQSGKFEWLKALPPPPEVKS